MSNNKNKKKDPKRKISIKKTADDKTLPSNVVDFSSAKTKNKETDNSCLKDEYPNFFDEALSSILPTSEASLNKEDCVDYYDLTITLSGTTITIEEIEQLIEKFDDETQLDVADSEEIKLYVNAINLLAGNGHLPSIEALAYAKYCGNRAFEEDFYMAEKLLLHLMDINNSPFTANTLGYIYYYGRTNNGNPDYDKAFYYYSIGSAGGVYESKYKLADMFWNGNAVPENRQIAFNLVQELYLENFELFCNRDYGCKFADVALRLGSILLTEITEQLTEQDSLAEYKNEPKQVIESSESGNSYIYGHDGGNFELTLNLEQAGVFLLQADYAINKRIENSNFIGDDSVKTKIKEQLDIFQSLSPAVSGNRLSSESLFITLYKLNIYTHFKYQGIKGTLTHLGETNYRLELVPIGSNHLSVNTDFEEYCQDSEPEFLVTLVDPRYCSFENKITIDIQNASEVYIAQKEISKYIADKLSAGKHVALDEGQIANNASSINPDKPDWGVTEFLCNDYEENILLLNNKEILKFGDGAKFTFNFDAS